MKGEGRFEGPVWFEGREGKGREGKGRGGREGNGSEMKGLILLCLV